MLTNNRLKVYAAPTGAVLQNDYILKVRAIGDENWQEVPTYQVKVDMHDVRYASMAYFDFEGEVELEVSGPFYICQAKVRPLSRGIEVENDTKKIRFKLSKPENLSVELNQNRYHNLHIFAGSLAKADIVEEGQKSQYVKIEGALNRANFLGSGLFTTQEFQKKRKLWIGPGLYYVDECTMHIPSNTEIYIEGGAVIVGAFICENVSNVKLWGRGVFYQAGFERFNGINGIRLSFCSNISLEGMIFVNPCHYTVHMGKCDDIKITDIKAFSCEGWSDGIDMMSCSNVAINGGFLRNSDDCIAIYGSRWSYHGNSSNILVENLTVWADVAHPLMVGIHGEHEKNGDTISEITFRNIDILEHNEPQAGYLGCMTLNAGDKNTIENVLFEDIRIEPFLHGKVLDVQVRWNKDYNPAPGKAIKNVTFRDIDYLGEDEVKSMINGYDESHFVSGILIENYRRKGKVCRSFEEANIKVGRHAFNVSIDERREK